jgi:hypothetical protein
MKTDNDYVSSGFLAASRCFYVTDVAQTTPRGAQTF